MVLDLTRPPIDEVVFGVILDKPLGPDSVAAGQYLSRRSDRFAQYEIHDAIFEDAAVILASPPPLRVWLISADDAWVVQLQPDRFSANWRRRGAADYPGFSRAGGAMDYLLDEFGRFQALCAERHDGVVPQAMSFELAKIDLLVQGRHWTDLADAAKMLPVLERASKFMAIPGPLITLQWREVVDGGTLAVTLVPVRLKANDGLAYRLECRFTAPVTADLREHLMRADAVVDDAFQRLIPADQHERFR